MNRRMTVLLILLVVVVAGGALAFGLTQSKTDSAACNGVQGANYHIIIKNGKASSTNTSGRLCDKLTFTNLDNITREIAFGPHEHHISYDGVAENFLNQNQSFTITMDAIGSYHWHDHLHDEITGNFTVSK